MTTPHDKALAAATKAWMDDRGIDSDISRWRDSIDIAISAYLSSIGGIVCAREPAEHQRLVPGFGWQRVDDEDLAHYGAKGMQRRTLHAPLSIAGKGDGGRAFAIGDRVRKIKGSSWQGMIVGFYSTELTPVGYCVESEREPGSVQIYPESALEALPAPPSLQSDTEGAIHD